MKNIYVEPVFDVISLVGCDSIITSGGGVTPGGDDSGSGFHGGDWG